MSYSDWLWITKIIRTMEETPPSQLVPNEVEGEPAVTTPETTPTPKPEVTADTADETIL
ncbi:hypothetical protein HYW72_01570 [Candidatus Nomurabacteria bacterium]|nr:hypothetical protein [Candidatus Nomurabacteria bacterium]